MAPLREASRGLAGDEAVAAPLSHRPVTGGYSAEHGDENAGVVDEVVGHCWPRVCLSDFGVVLIHGVTAGFEGPECNLGNRERSNVS
jgi:hypothetical protein